MKRIALCCVLATLCLAGRASAQITLSVGGGPSFDVGTDVPISSGFNAQVAAELGIPLFPVGVRVDGALNRFSLDQIGGNFRMLSGTANAILELPGILLVPYAIAGAGMYNVKLDPDTGSESSQTHWGFNGGVGARFGIAGIGVFAEARIHALSDFETVVAPVVLGIRF